MNKFLITSTIFILAVSNPALSKEPKPSERENGIYTQKVGSGAAILFYTVDTLAKLCFVSPGGGSALTSIDCNQLKNREAWQEIINW